jgi:hypothetical protein
MCIRFLRPRRYTAKTTRIHNGNGNGPFNDTPP